MNRIILYLSLIVVFQGNLRAQDPALVERVNRLSIYVEELMADKARQQKQITEMSREIDSLREQLQRVSGGVSREDVQAVVNTVTQLERKQREDMKSVADAIEKLGKASATPARAPSPSGPVRPAERGWEYTIEPGNTLSAVAQAYREKFNIKTTTDDILKANPGLRADRLQVGQVIFIPER